MPAAAVAVPITRECRACRVDERRLQAVALGGRVAQGARPALAGERAVTIGSGSACDWRRSVTATEPGSPRRATAGLRRVDGDVGLELAGSWRATAFAPGAFGFDPGSTRVPSGRSA